jgi:hypothetical protein
VRVSFFKVFWFIYLLEFVAPIALIFHYLYGYEVNFIIKVPLIIYFLLVVFFHFKNKLILNPLTFFFLGFSILSFFYGVLVGNSIDNKFFSHIYFASIPILGASFGYHFARLYEEKFRSFFLKIINISFYITCFILLIYFYLHFITGSVAYWGFGTDMHLLIPFILLQGKYSAVLVGIIFVVLSGKRATLLNVILELMMYFSYMLRSLRIKSLPKTIFITSVFIACFTFAYSLGAFSRFEASLQFDLNDEDAMLYATSGRWQEITGIIEHHNAKPERWILGSGFGGRYEWFIPLDNYLEMKHYAHFAPFAYIFLFGVPFTVLLYSFFIFYIIKGRDYLANPFMIVFVVGVFSSFFGANLFVDIKIWIFFGVVQFLIKNPKSSISNIQLK